MSPEYITSAALEFGNGDAVLGSKRAWLESRNLIKNYLTYVRKTKNSGKDLEIALTFRALGFMGTTQTLQELPSRTPMIALFQKNNPTIPGLVTIPIDVDQNVANQKIIIAVSKALRAFPSINRALLRGKVYQRFSSEVMINVELSQDNIRSYISDFAQDSPEKVKTKQFRALKRMLRVERHELRRVGEQILMAWAETGLIHSPAGAMITCVNNIEQGWAAPLTNFNGIPLVVTICKAENGTIKVCASGDHRCIDGSGMAKFYEFIKHEVGVGEKNNSNRRIKGPRTGHSSKMSDAA